MTTRNPVVLVNGSLAELPAGDSVNGALNSIYQYEIDFGSMPVYSGVFTTTNAAILSTHKIMAFQSGDAATGRSSDENEFDAFSCSAIASTGSVKFYVSSVNGPVTGKYKINYVIG